MQNSCSNDYELMELAKEIRKATEGSKDPLGRAINIGSTVSQVYLAGNITEETKKKAERTIKNYLERKGL